MRRTTRTSLHKHSQWGKKKKKKKEQKKWNLGNNKTEFEKN